jgi:hypothetical protein
MTVDVPGRESFYLYQYRVLVFLLFKSYPFVKYSKQTSSVHIVKMSQFANAVGYRSYKVRRALKELERLHIIHDLKFSYNQATFLIEKVQLS